MRLLALELHGFKSFADPQRLIFPGGMTAVVGPNGCGKSNIADALAWVLGEQRATLLRGTEMADVIFAGTSERKPTGLAEVKLTLEMLDPATQLPREVMLSRRLYRDTGAEYRINSQSCRLKDIQDLLMDTGMGTRAYSFIQQGQIDLILSTKPKDRRSLLEEAAGITRYKLRRGDAEKRLEETRANLQRLDDILLELSKQQESLKRQAAKARRAQELDAVIQSLKRLLLAGKALHLAETRDALLATLEAMEQDIARLTAQAAERASEVEDARLRLDELQMQQEKLGRTLLGIDQRLGLATQDKGFQEERLLALDEQLAQSRLQVTRLDDRQGDSQEETKRLEEALGKAELLLAEEEAQVAHAQEALALAGGALSRVEGELRALQQARMEAEKAAHAIEKARRELHQQIAQLEGRLDALNHEEALRAPRLDGLLEEDRRLDKALEGAEARLEEMEEALHVQQRRHQEAQQAQQASGKALREAESLLDSQERKVRQLAEEWRSASSSEESEKALAFLRARGESPAPISDAFQVTEEALGAVERLLGVWAGAYGLSDGGWSQLGQVPGALWATVAQGEETVVEGVEGAVPLRGHITWKSAQPRWLEGLFHRVLLCEDDALPGLAKAHPHLGFVSPRLVKLPFGPLQVGASAPARSPLKLRSEWESARQAREVHLEALYEWEAKQKEQARRLQEETERLREMEEDRQRAKRTWDDQQSRSASVKAQLREIREAQARSDAQWEGLEKEIAAHQSKLRELEKPEETPEMASLLANVHEAEQKRQQAQGCLEACRAQLMEATQRRTVSWGERDHLQRQLQQWQRSAFDMEEEKKRLAQSIAQALQKKEQAQVRLVTLEEECQGLLQERERVQGQHQALSPVMDEASDALRVQERIQRESQQQLEQIRQQHQQTLLQGAQVQGSLEALAREVELTLDMAVADFLDSLSDTEREACQGEAEAHQARLNEVQAKRLDLGSVNPLAMQELEEAESRLGFMRQQRQDVVDAMTNLEATIKEINATSEVRFKEAFDYINARFGEVFSEVFGGGNAHLTLQDPTDLLECGIEIMAQPPGKTAKALTLLSGGEKALTAISLLFAIFQFKPSPFCVLDEVDAPLDEANVARFAALVQRMKAGTQFIVITHQKPTMMAADTLYGVTMAERGVSRLVSVQLKEAQTLVS